MKTKLTLSIDKDLVQYARHQARQDGGSISSMFSTYIRNRKSRTERQATPSVDAMVGSLKDFPIDDSKQAIRQVYADKHTR